MSALPFDSFYGVSAQLFHLQGRSPRKAKEDYLNMIHLLQCQDAGCVSTYNVAH